MATQQDQAEEREQYHSLLAAEDDLPPIEESPMLRFFVLEQTVDLEVNFRDRRIHGTTDIRLALLDDTVEDVVLDAANCEIDTENIYVAEVRQLDGEAVPGPKRKTTASFADPYARLSQPKNWNLRAEHHDLRRIRARNVFHSRRRDEVAENRELGGCTPVYGSLKINLRGKAEQDRPRLIIRKSTLTDPADRLKKVFQLTIPFRNRSIRDGLHFVGVDPLDSRFTHMYTRNSIQPGTASCIFPCVDDHGSRCEWKISIKHPRTLGDALQQALVTQQTTSKPGDQMEVDEQDGALHLAEEDKLKEMTVICTGFLHEERVDPDDSRKKIMTFVPEKKLSVQKLGFAVGPFEHIDLSSEYRLEEDEVKLGTNALKVHAYCLPGRADLVRHTACTLTTAADFFTYTFAKYPFQSFKMCFLDDMVEDTVVLYSTAFVSNRLLFPKTVIDTEIEVSRKLVYTLASQWVGINMIPNTRKDLWLVVGIAHYMTDLFMKRLCGNNEYRFRMKTMSDKLVEVDVERPSLYDLGSSLHLGDFEMDFMNLKAPVIFFILDKRLIKASGGHGLTRILQKLMTKAQIEQSDKSTILDTEKFRATCEKGSRYRLETFWQQWVYGSGCPRFDVKAKFNKKRLCVELTLNQCQLQTVKKPGLEKAEFFHIVKERRAGVKPGDVQPLFTGPMTIRIHEADGTPYEHILEIREDATRSTKFEIPYNTKYKRLKRTRRMKEKQNVGASMDTEIPDDTLLYCLGDVLQTPEEMAQWELKEWDPDIERKMDQESYEWIRVDADFEWACDMKRTLEPYMYVSQLQQDRDVVAQQDAMLFLASANLHPIVSGFLLRTLVDRRYFHGIRTMAAQALPRQANIKGIPMLGLRHLMKAFREMFCFQESNQPRPNDFSDKRQYNVQCAIIKAIAQVRDQNTDRCPLEARRFILDQLLFNNNEDNPFSDHFYIALLVESLATSMIPSKEDDWFALQNKVPNPEEKEFLEQAMEQIERVLRRDEWTSSYQNVWTIAGLDAKQRLMKAGVIPKNFLDFGQYLLDGTIDLIRIKAFEALIDLGAMMEPQMFTFLIYALTTDRSPYVRMKLIDATASGLAAIAFGEHTKAVKNEPAPEEADALLLVQDSAQEIEARKEKFARKENLEAALRALRREMEETYGADERHYSTAMRKALDSPDLGRAELESLLDLAAMMFEEARSWVMTLNLPKTWKVERPAQQLANQLRVIFKSVYKDKPKEPLMPPPPPPTASSQALPSIAAAAPTTATAVTLDHTPAVEAKRPAVVQRTSSIKIKTNSNSNATPQRHALPSGASNDTIVASPVPRQSSAGAATPKPPRPAESSSATSSSKRPRPDKEESHPPASKRPKIEKTASSDGGGEKRKRLITTLKTNPKRLAMIIGHQSPAPQPNGRTSLPTGPKASSSVIKDSIVAKPARKPLPTGDAVRKPLPGAPAPSPQAPPAALKATPQGSATPTPKPKSVSPAVTTPSTAPPKRIIKLKVARKPDPEPSPGPPPAAS